MTATPPPPKFVALNATAARRQQYVVGNPVNTRLEAGVGNCFPGLEMDLRNLERRFFPFLEVDFITAVEDNQPPPHIPNTIEVVSVDLDGVNASALPGDVQAAYAAIAADVNGGNAIWRIEQISGGFGLFGSKSLQIRTLSPENAVVNGTPPDGWTAVRLLSEGKPVTVTVVRDGSDGPGSTFTITQNRVAYLDDNGSFNQIFEPGELSQSLCSPWTHDFRDCACFYWASNHPDIVLPPTPETVPDDQRWRLSVPWERSDRGTLDNPSAPALQDGAGERELDYYEINRRWQELDIVVEGRELRRSYQSGILSAAPFAAPEELEANLRYAAGIERAAVQTYLSAAFSLNPIPADAGSLRVDSATSFAELMRIAISEMRHLRIVNDVLREINAGVHPGTIFRPALQIALDFPASFEHPQPVPERRLTPEVLEEFIDVEKPSDTLDGLYARIFVSLGNFSFPNLAQTIRSVMTDGFDHYETFLDMREWLGRHHPNDYLLNLHQPGPDDPAHKHLQQLLLQVLQTLRQGYSLGLPRGGEDIAHARGLMLGNGLLTACEDLRARGLMVIFDPISSDPDFGMIARPPSSK
jgi:rubrerythrin